MVHKKHTSTGPYLPRTGLIYGRCGEMEILLDRRSRHSRKRSVFTIHVLSLLSEVKSTVTSPLLRLPIARARPRRPRRRSSRAGAAAASSAVGPLPLLPAAPTELPPDKKHGTCVRRWRPRVSKNWPAGRPLQTQQELAGWTVSTQFRVVFGVAAVHRIAAWHAHTPHTVSLDRAPPSVASSHSGVHRPPRHCHCSTPTLRRSSR